MSTGGDDRDRYTEDWFEEPRGEREGGFRDPGAETWLEEEADQYAGPGERRPLIAIIAAAVVLVLAGIGLARVLGGDDEEPQAPTGQTATAPTATDGAGTGETLPTEPVVPAISVPEETTLRSGDESEAVALLQQALTRLGYDVGTADGVFGPATQEAVMQFQADTGLEADGIAGPATLAAINEALAAGG